MDAKLGVCMQHFCNQYAQNNYSAKAKTSCVIPFKEIEGMVKRLISDKEITPNISHMGYENGEIFTNDREFKFRKDFAPNLFKDKRYVTRGSISLVFPCNYHYDKWLEDEEMF